MKYFGKRSVASTLKKIINVLYFLGVTGVFIVTIGAVMIFFNPQSQTFNTYDLLSVIYDIDSNYHPVITDQINVSPDLNDTKIRLHASIDYKLGNPILGILLYFLFMIILNSGLIILKLLKRILASLEDGNFFTMQNAKRLRQIGLIIISVQVILLLSALSSLHYFDGLISSPGFSINLNLGYIQSVAEEFIGQIFSGVIIILFAEIFNTGAKMKEEQELTV